MREFDVATSTDQAKPASRVLVLETMLLGVSADNVSHFETLLLDGVFVEALLDSCGLLVKGQVEWILRNGGCANAK